MASLIGAFRIYTHEQCQKEPRSLFPRLKSISFVGFVFWFFYFPKWRRRLRQMQVFPMSFTVTQTSVKNLYAFSDLLHTHKLHRRLDTNYGCWGKTYEISARDCLPSWDLIWLARPDKETLSQVLQTCSDWKVKSYFRRAFFQNGILDSPYFKYFWTIVDHFFQTDRLSIICSQALIFTLSSVRLFFEEKTSLKHFLGLCFGRLTRCDYVKQPLR